MTSAPPPGFTILRIKRKITEDPLESLLIDDSYRPKKRSKEVSGQTSGNKGVFRLADTVGEGWEEGTGGEALRSKIARLLSSSQQQPPSSPSTSFPSPSPPPPPSHSQPHLRYRIIAPPAQPRPSRRAPTAPPVIQTTPDPSLPPPLKYIDAHPVIVVPTSNFQAQVGGNLILPPTGPGGEEEEDPDVAAFLPMLREYLAVSNPIPSTTSSSAPTPTQSPTPTAPDQYVYDLYYHSVSHPTSSSSNNEAMMVARATVEGYIAEGEEELMVESDEGEESDEVDEDSNDEDFYRNDYPEEEAGDSEDSYGNGIGSGAEDRWEEDY